MLQNRLKQLRLARGLTLEALSEQLDGLVTKQALSKYEKGLSKPSMTVLAKIAESLDVKTAYLFSDQAVTVDLLAYRKHSALLKRDQETIESFVSQALEERIRLQELVQEPIRISLPIKRFKVASLTDAEKAAAELRKLWKLGEAPIANVVGLLEEQFIHVFEIDAPSEKFDGISARAHDEEGKLKAAAVVSRRGLPGERQRLNLVHELGHLVLDVSENVDEEKAAFRFAGAFLAPATVLLREVGAKRSSIQLRELLILKKRFGISIQAMLYRLRDLEVINESTYTWSCIQINKLGFKKNEPDPLQPEEHQWLKLNVLRAVSEGFLSKEDAERLIGETMEEEERQFMDRRAFMKLPLAQRRKILEEQAATLKSHYEKLVEEEEPGGGDFLDY